MPPACYTQRAGGVRVRVVAGSLGGRRLAVPRFGTRPTSDRVRQAVFDRLSPELPGAEVLDLYAGSGSLGIEALSRGAARAMFVEVAPAAVRTLRQNLTALALEARAEVWAVRAARALRDLGETGRRFDLVLADPPYGLEILDEISRIGTVLRPGALLVLERSARAPEAGVPVGLIAERSARYGETALQFFRSSGTLLGSNSALEEDAHARGVSGHV